MLDYRLFLIVFAVFIIVVLLFGYVSLASVCAALSLPVGVYALYGMDTVYLIFGVFISAAVVYLHRANIKRIFSGAGSGFSFRKGKKNKYRRMNFGEYSRNRQRRMGHRACRNACEKRKTSCSGRFWRRSI